VPAQSHPVFSLHFGRHMTTIRLKENEPFEVALRRFKRTIEKNGLLPELRAREFYEKPTAERKRCGRGSFTRSPPPNANASATLPSSAITSACAASCCRRSYTDRVLASARNPL